MEIRVRDVDPELHMAFKLTCISNGLTIENACKQLIEEYVKREKKAPYSGRSK